MKLTTIALVTAIALSGTFAYAQTNSGTPGSPAARQETGDPLIRKPTSGQTVVKKSSTGVTTGNSMRNGSARARETGPGGPPSSQESGTERE